MISDAPVPGAFIFLKLQSVKCIHLPIICLRFEATGVSTFALSKINNL